MSPVTAPKKTTPGTPAAPAAATTGPLRPRPKESQFEHGLRLVRADAELGPKFRKLEAKNYADPNDKGLRFVLGKLDTPGRHGEYDPNTNTVTVNSELAQKLSLQEMVQVIAHEGMHGVQNAAGKTPGPDTFTDKAAWVRHRAEHEAEAAAPAYEVSERLGLPTTSSRVEHLYQDWQRLNGGGQFGISNDLLNHKSFVQFEESTWEDAHQ